MMKLVVNNNVNGTSSTNNSTTNNTFGTNSSNTQLNTINSAATNQQCSVTGGHYNVNKSNYHTHYQNPPLAPRFLALNAQQQQQQQQVNPLQTRNQLNHVVLNANKNMLNQQNNSPTISLSQTIQQQQQQQQQTNITSGNSLQSFIAARKLGLMTNPNNNNNTNSNICNNNNNNTNGNTLNSSTVYNIQSTSCITQNNATLIASLAAASSSSATTAMLMNQQQQLAQCTTLNNTLFVGNLHASLQEIDLIQVFRPFGRIVECCKKWLHFGFVKFSSEEEACHAYITLNGFRLKGRPMRLEFQNRTKKARIKAMLAQSALQSSNKSNEIDENNLFQQFGQQNKLNMLLSSSSGANNNHLNNNFNNSPLNFGGFTSSSSSSLNQFSFNPIIGSKNTEQQQKRGEFPTSSEFSLFDTEKLLKFAYGYETENEPKLPSYVELAWNSVDLKNEQQYPQPQQQQSNDTTINKQWLDVDSLNKLKPNTISPANSALCDNDLSTSSSSLLSKSSDSGCRSSSYLFDEKKLTITKFTTNTDAANSRCDTPVTNSISEHLEFTYSHSISEQHQQQNQQPKEQIKLTKAALEKHTEDSSDLDNDDDDGAHSCISSSGTSDDASIIPIDADLNYDEEEFNMDNTQTMDSQTSKISSLLSSAGDIDKSKNDFGVYFCMKNTNSLFIEPEDELKPLYNGDFQEYCLFPMMQAVPNNESDYFC